MSELQLHQIFYDDTSLGAIDPLCIPLDNTRPRYPKFFEFSAILEYFRSHEIVSNHWYGFLSPKFYIKTAITIPQLLSHYQQVKSNCDIISCTSGWDQISYFRNSFEQGDYFHKGLIESANEFLNHYGIDFDPQNSIGTLNNTIYSNYLLARGRYWSEWLNLAENLVDFYELNTNKSSSLKKIATYYMPDVEMMVFIQERLHSILLSMMQFRVNRIDTTLQGPVLTSMFDDNEINRKLLRTCNALKEHYLETKSGDKSVELFNFIRSLIHKKL